MLNKEVCRHCINQMEKVSIPEFSTDSVVGIDIMRPCFRGWYEKDEENWKEGIVKCRIVPAKRCKTSSPPSWCAYTAEHLICQSEESNAQ